MKAKLLLLPWKLCAIILVESSSILPAGYLDVYKLAIQLGPILVEHLNHRHSAGMGIEVCVWATLVSSTPLLSR